MFLPKILLELKALVALPPAVERFLARRPQGRRFVGLHCYVRGRVLDRYREEAHRGNTGQLAIARTDGGAEVRVDLTTGAVIQVDAGGGVEHVAPSFEAWLQGQAAAAKVFARRPLVRAARASDTKKIARLLARGADINEQDLDGVTPLMAALLAWQYDAAALLLQHAPDLSLRDREGHTALMWAAFRNQPEFVAQIIAAGADVNARTCAGEPVLLYALTGPHRLSEGRPNGSMQVVELLVGAGADVQALARTGAARLPEGMVADIDPAIVKYLEARLQKGS